MKNNQKGQASVILVIIIIILLIGACAGLGYILINKNNKKTNVEIPTNKIAEEVSELKVNANIIDLSKFGQINKDNIKVISKNIYQVKDQTGNYKIYNKNLDVLLDGFQAEYGTENLVAVNKDNSYGVISVEGKEILKPTFYGIKIYSDNVISAQVVKNSQVLYGIYNGEGKEVLPCEYSNLKYYSDNLILVGNSEGYIVVDSTGKTILKIADSDYFNVDIVNDKTLIGMDNQKWKYGLMDLQEKAVIEFKYDRIEALNSKFVKAELNGLWGIIDLEGNIIVPFKYKWSMDISQYGDLFLADTDSKSTYYNKKGTVVYETSDVKLQAVSPGKYLVTEKAKTSEDENQTANQVAETVYQFRLIDKDGAQIDNIAGAETVQANGEDLIVYKANDKFGLIDSSLNVVTGNIYKNLVVNKYSCIASDKTGLKYGIVSKKGEELVKFDYSEADYVEKRDNYEMILLQKDGIWKLAIIDKV